jgi:hypothetical protein
MLDFRDMEAVLSGKHLARQIAGSPRGSPLVYRINGVPAMVKATEFFGCAGAYCYLSLGSLIRGGG